MQFPPAALLWMTVVAAPPVTAATTPHELDISPTTGCGPLTVQLTGDVFLPATSWYEAYIYWGDGTYFKYVAHWAAVDLYIDESHTYQSPGVYTVVRTLHWGDNTEPSFVDSSTVITVSPSGFDVECDTPPDECPTRFRVLSPDTIPDCLTGAIVEWGDGAIDAFVWDESLSRFVTPFHDYTEDGEYTVTIPSTYDGAGDYFATMNVVAGCTTPVESTTWGRVKSLYR